MTTQPVKEDMVRVEEIPSNTAVLAAVYPFVVLIGLAAAAIYALVFRL